MRIIIHLSKMTLKVLRERGWKALIQRIGVFLAELADGIWFYFRSGCFAGKIYDVLYISGCPGGSRLYRCHNQAEELKQYGLTAYIISQNNPVLKFVLPHFKVYIFQRVIYDRRISMVIELIKKQPKPIFYETDDLVFDPGYIPYIHYFNYFSSVEKEWYRNGIGREILEDPHVKYTIVSTHYLGEALHKKYPDKRISVSTNKLSQDQVRWAREALAKKDRLKKPDRKIRLGYFSGSKSHDRDFSSVIPALERILDEHKNAVIMAVGHLNLEESFMQRYKDRIELRPFVPLEKLPELISQADINIVPLEIDNPFCQAKSGLKYFEAGLVQVPTIATATDPMARIIRDGKNGFLASTPDAWYEKLALLIKDETLRAEMGQTAREDSLRHHTTLGIHEDTKQLANIIKQEIDNQDKIEKPL